MQKKYLFAIFITALIIANLLLVKTEHTVVENINTEPLIIIPTVATTSRSEAKPKTKTLVINNDFHSSTTTENLIKRKLDEKFTPESSKIALAVLKIESGLKVRAVGYDCFYDQNGAVKQVRSSSTRSRSCKIADRELNYAKDCGLIQYQMINVKSCPEYTFDLDWSIKTMHSMHSKRGFKPWSAYNDKSYLRYMN